MTRKIDKSLWRIIDANFNRAKEGLRVCEDICRFIYNMRALTTRYKTMRHQLSAIVSAWSFELIIQARDMRRDVGKRTTAAEQKRQKVSDVFYANSQRVKESLRVLEEFSKLIDERSVRKIKSLRYQVYATEKILFRHHEL